MKSSKRNKFYKCSCGVSIINYYGWLRGKTNHKNCKYITSYYFIKNKKYIKFIDSKYKEFLISVKVFENFIYFSKYDWFKGEYYYDDAIHEINGISEDEISEKELINISDKLADNIIFY